MRIRKTLLAGAALALAFTSFLAPAAASAGTQEDRHGYGGGHDSSPEMSLLADGLQGASGSTIGPDGALYVVEGTIGQVTRIDRRTGEQTPFVTGLPTAIIPIGGPIDVDFIDDTAYVLVANVGADVPPFQRNDVDGIYRVDGPDSFTVIADIGEWSLENPPPADIDIFLTRGVQFRMLPYRDGFLVTDGHHNRVLRVTLDGDISQVEQFSNIVPTGLASQGSRVYMAQMGPVPHVPADGRIVSFRVHDPEPREVASGYPMLVDVEFGPDGLYALSQGDWPGTGPDGSPASPDTGRLLLVDDGEFSVVVDELDRPTSVEFRRDTAYVVTLDGEVWRIDAGSGRGHHGGGGGAHHWH